ncbi:MAG: phenylalanine--tRNA ligase subunit beta, partial [Planctomycetes bacterium]|nr:phenylalanine--tRNA ligase subunit beta [Planctomycetota bacterium]
MKLTYNWLKEFVPGKLPPVKLAHLLTMHGVKVENHEPAGHDTMFEFEITANRPDCLSVIGVARETAVLTGKTLRLPNIKIPKEIRTVKNILKIEETKGCPYYIARVIKNVKVGPSPKWLKERIEAIGLRPVNNIVDISNYVLYEYGEPMHAFDLDKLTEQRVIVRRARQGEKMPAINDKTYQLEPDMLVIADSKKPVAIAGVMGGKLTEVSEQTTNLLLETAYFNPAMVRKTSRQLALISDSSYRFERGVTPSTIDPASRRAVELILKLAGGELTEEQIINRLKQKPKQIIVRFDRANKVLGITVKKPEVKRILKGLGFKIKNESASRLKVEIPDFRRDVDREID